MTKKKSEMPVDLTDGSHEVNRIPIAGYDQPVESKYLRQRPVIETE